MPLIRTSEEFARQLIGLADDVVYAHVHWRMVTNSWEHR
jgi:hypothetical protein